MYMEGKVFEILSACGPKGIKTLSNFFENEEELLKEGYLILDEVKTRLVDFKLLLEKYLPPENYRNIFAPKKKKKVLFVDDDDMWRAFYEETGHLLGYSVRLAADATKALEILSKEKPDIVVTDIKMPNINGIRLLKEMRIRKYNIPAIIITGYPSEKIEKAAEKINVKKVLVKPIRIRELKETLDLLN